MTMAHETLVEEKLVQQKLPTLDELRACVPKHCFEKNLILSFSYLIWDLAVVAFLYKVEPVFEMAGLPGILFWYFLIGMELSAIFCIGHDCGHSTFSNYEWVNDLVGHFTHGMIFAPYWPWQTSHRMHHTYTSHITKDRGHPWTTEEEYSGYTPARRFFGQNAVTAFVRWQVYTILGYGDGSHFWPGSVLCRNNVERVKCVVSAAVCVAWASLAYWYFGTPYLFMKFYVLPVLCHGFWLIMITFLQHQADDIQVYEDGTWTYVKGQLQTIDRPYGFGIDTLLHHITDGHVAHHFFFTTVPHYHLMEATDAISKKLEPYGVYRKENTYDFLYRFAYLNHTLNYLIGEGTGVLGYAKTKHVD